MHAEVLGPFRSGQDDKVVTTNMTDKIIGIAIFIDDLLTNTPDQEDHIVACEETIDIVEGFEVVEVKIEDAPGVHIAKLVVDSPHNLHATRQTGKGRKIVLLYTSQLSTYTRK